MLQQIILLLVDTIGALVVGACLIRLWMQYRRIPMRNQVGSFVLVLTNWIVLPIRRVVPGIKGVDWASLIAAYVLSLALVAVYLVSIYAETGFGVLPSAELVLGLAVIWLVKWALYVAALVIIGVAVLSWVNPFHPALPIFNLLAEPMLGPIRKLLPAAGRFDLSPLFAFLIVQIALILLHGLSNRWLGVF